MTLQELKASIENNTLYNDCIIFECKGSGEFIFSQYVEEFTRKNNLSIEYLDDLPTYNPINLFNVLKSELSIFTTDNLTTAFEPQELLWIKCKSVSKELRDEYAQYIVSCPPLEDWMLRDYAYSKCTKIEKTDLDELLKIYKDNIFSINSELDKLSLFNNSSAYNLIKDQLYIEDSAYSIFDLVNAIIQYDLPKLTSIMLNVDAISIDIFGLQKLLLNNFKNVIDVQLTPNATAYNTSMTGKQFWVIQQFACNKYSREQLIFIYETLLNIDLKIKTGLLDTEQAIVYLINKIITSKETIN